MMQPWVSTNFEKIKARVLWEYETNPEELVCYSTGTCWWCILRDNPYRATVPCDPLGAVLLQAPIKAFIDKANENPAHYGKHGIQAFWAAYHGVILTGCWLPTALKSWEEYNKLLDEYFKNQTETEKRLVEQEEKLMALNQQLSPEMKQKMLDDLIKELNDD
jgi:hypothetical protein